MLIPQAYVTAKISGLKYIILGIRVVSWLINIFVPPSGVLQDKIVGHGKEATVDINGVGRIGCIRGVDKQPDLVLLETPHGIVLTMRRQTAVIIVIT